MPLRDLLNLRSAVTIIKTISTSDGMGGFSITTTSSILALAALWQNDAYNTNKFLSDKIVKNSTHTLCYEYGKYTFGSIVTGSTIIESVSYNGGTYKTVGFMNNIMNLNEIIVQALEQIS